MSATAEGAGTDIAVIAARAETANTAQERLECLEAIETSLVATPGPEDRAALLMCRARLSSNLWQSRQVLSDALGAMSLFEEAGAQSRAVEAASLAAAHASRLGELSLAAEMATKCILALSGLEDRALVDVANRLGIFCYSFLDFDRAAGLTVIGTAGSDKGKALVAQEGAHHVLDHKAPSYLDDLMKLTGGRGVDLIIEMLSNVNLGKDLTILARNGRVVVVGSRGTVEINPRDTMVRDASILGMTLLNASEAELFSMHAALVAGLENGTLRPVVGQEIPLAEAARAHKAVMEPGAYGKIVLIP